MALIRPQQEDPVDQHNLAKVLMNASAVLLLSSVVASQTQMKTNMIAQGGLAQYASFWVLDERIQEQRKTLQLQK